MKYMLITIGIIFSLCIFTSCTKVVGEGPLVTQTRAVQSFKGVTVSTDGRINYKIAPEYKVEIQAQQNVQSIIDVFVQGNELVIKYRNNTNVIVKEDIVITISAPSAEFVNLSGSGDFTMLSTITGANLAVKVSGSGNIFFPLIDISGTLTATISGSGNIHIADGFSKNEQLRISGSGKMELVGLLAETAFAEISGSGDIRVNLSKSLNASISGSGSVYYKGLPAVSSRISGSGTVRPY